MTYFTSRTGSQIHSIRASDVILFLIGQLLRASVRKLIGIIQFRLVTNIYLLSFRPLRSVVANVVSCWTRIARKPTPHEPVTET